MLEFIGWLFSSLASWITAATSGAVAAWFLTVFRDRWRRPRLALEIDIDRGSVVETKTLDGARHQKWARLVVHNQGGTLAKNCCASIDYIKRIDPTGSHYVFRSDLVDLNWSLLIEPRTLLHVPLGGHRLLDVGHTDISDADLTANKVSGTRFSIAGANIPQRLIAEFRMNATYEMHIRAYADNAAPVEYSCRIQVRNTFRDLSFEPCSDPRPRDQR
jgi:hypothetical protein